MLNTPPPDTRLLCTTVTTPAAVAALREEWRALLAASPTSLFGTWEWAEAWYHAFTHSGQPQCLCVRDMAGRLVGLAPLFRPYRSDGNLARGELGYLGTHGPAWGHYPAFPAQPGAEAAVLATLFGSLSAPGGLRLLRVQPDSPLLPLLAAAAAEADWAMYARPGLCGAYAALPDDPDRVLDSLPDADHRGNCRTGLRRLRREHPAAEFRLVSDPTEVRQVLGELARLNIARHDRKGESSHFRNPAYCECFYRSQANFLAAGWLRLHVLQLGARVLAAASLVLHHGMLTLMHTGFDQEFAVYSPSHLLLVQALEDAVREGARRLDMLIWYGYKGRYCTLREPLVNVQLLPPTPRAVLPLAWELPQSAARALRRRLGKRRGE